MPAESPSARLADVGARFPLPWSHYVRLLTVSNREARAFCETEALRNGWSLQAGAALSVKRSAARAIRSAAPRSYQSVA